MAIVGTPDAVAAFARQIGFGVAFVPVPACNGPTTAPRTGVHAAVQTGGAYPDSQGDVVVTEHFNIADDTGTVEAPRSEDSEAHGDTCSPTLDFVSPPATSEFGCQAWIRPVRARRGRVNGRAVQADMSIVFSDFSDDDAVNSELSEYEFHPAEGADVGDVVKLGTSALSLNPAVNISGKYGKVVMVSDENILVQCRHTKHVHPDKVWVAQGSLLRKGDRKRPRPLSAHGCERT